MDEVHKSNLSLVNINFVHDIMRRRLLVNAGVLLEERPRLTLDQILKNKWSPEFITMMQNRMLVGGFRHGLRKLKDLDYYSVMRESQKRLEAYINTGNDELLVDVANFCLLVFKFGNHPKKHLAVYKAERFEDK